MAVVALGVIVPFCVGEKLHVGEVSAIKMSCC